MEDISPPLLFKTSLENWFGDLNAGCPLSATFLIISSAVEFHFRQGLKDRVPYHFSSSPDPRKVQRPSKSNFAQADTEAEFCLHTSSLRFWSESVSVYIAMRMILVEKLSCCGSWVNPATRTRLAPRRCRRADDILGSGCSSIYHHGSVYSMGIRCLALTECHLTEKIIIHQLQDKEIQHVSQNVPSTYAYETCLMPSPQAHQTTAHPTCCVHAATEFCESCHPQTRSSSDDVSFHVQAWTRRTAKQ